MLLTKGNISSGYLVIRALFSCTYNIILHGRFIAVMHDEQEGIIPGNALVVDAKKRFRPLSKFGNAFLNRFSCSNTTSEVLKVNN